MDIPPINNIDWQIEAIRLHTELLTAAVNLMTHARASRVELHHENIVIVATCMPETAPPGPKH